MNVLVILFFYRIAVFYDKFVVIISFVVDITQVDDGMAFGIFNDLAFFIYFSVYPF